jgi:tRNA-specific adenosine deaminase 1
MLHTAKFQDPTMAALKDISDATTLSAITEGTAVRGRNGYSNYGAIRTKPGRTDSLPTISFSCSDKIATWCALGLQGALLERTIDPVYLDGIVVGGIDKVGPNGDSSWRSQIRSEAERALYGRLGDLQGMSIVE